MRQLPEGDYQEPTTLQSGMEKPKKSLTRYNIEAKFDNDDRMILNLLGYPRPNDFFETNTGKLREINDEVKNEVSIMTGEIAGLKKRKQKTEEEKETIELLQMQKNTLNRYKNILDIYLKHLNYKKALVFFTLTTHINFLTDLNYLVVPYLLKIME